ncbi:MAG: histidine kinase [Rhodomicrobium sp.]|nr:MAG: histidine kinase [Rhodomicrobium sp.]
MSDSKAYEQAKKRAENKIGFYIHLAIYAGVNAILAVVDLASSPEKLWFYWPLAGWGIGVLLHWFAVFYTPANFSFKEKMIEAELEKQSKDKS